MFDAANDPLGNSLRTRASQKRFEYQQQNPGSSFGPLPDSRWDGFFQALNERGVTRLADDSVGNARGMWSSTGVLPGTYDPKFQTSAVETMPSNQIGTPGRQKPLGARGSSIASMDALLGLANRKGKR